MSTFTLSFSGGAAHRLYLRQVGDLDRALPWHFLEPVTGDAARQRAANDWMDSAYNEHHSATLMAELLSRLTAASAPLDLCAVASGFVQHELVHAELCARLALRLAKEPVLSAAPAAGLPQSPELSPLQRASDAVLRLCCLGEELSFAWLQAMRRQSREPLTRAVLARLIKDEALHHRFGWMYLEWVSSTFDAQERARLAGVAAAFLTETAQYFAIAPAPTTPAAETYGVLDPASVGSVARRTLVRTIAPRLASFGIVIDQTPGKSLAA